MCVYGHKRICSSLYACVRAKMFRSTNELDFFYFLYTCFRCQSPLRVSVPKDIFFSFYFRRESFYVLKQECLALMI